MKWKLLEINVNNCEIDEEIVTKNEQNESVIPSFLLQTPTRKRKNV
jgi:hypothetical protein